MLKKYLAVAAAFIALTGTASAAPITGQFSITGLSVLDDGSSLTFNPATINVGAANTLSGAFQTLLTPQESGRMTPTITYAPTYTAGSGFFTLTNSTDSVTFVLNTLVRTVQSGFGLFTGTGIISTSLAGYDPTQGSLAFSTQGNGTVTFSATAIGATAVPEPASVALLGVGLLGLTVLARKKGHFSA